MSVFGSYSGIVTIALTSPVDGSIATTAPPCGATFDSSSNATCWSFGSMVVVTVAPRFGWLRIRSLSVEPSMSFDFAPR